MPRETGKGGIGEYLRKQVEASGGMCEKVKREGRRGGPDYEVTWPGGHIHLIETKWPDGKAAEHQLRDHARRSKLGVHVRILDTREGIIQYVTWCVTGFR